MPQGLALGAYLSLNLSGPAIARKATIEPQAKLKTQAPFGLKTQAGLFLRPAAPWQGLLGFLSPRAQAATAPRLKLRSKLRVGPSFQSGTSFPDSLRPVIQGQFNVSMPSFLLSKSGLASNELLGISCSESIAVSAKQDLRGTCGVG